MLHTIQVSRRVTAQGILVELLPNGEAIVRDGDTVYRGRPISSLPGGVDGPTRHASGANAEH
jgi:hypothetical protein